MNQTQKKFVMNEIYTRTCTLLDALSCASERARKEQYAEIGLIRLNLIKVAIDTSSLKFNKSLDMGKDILYCNLQDVFNLNKIAKNTRIVRLQKAIQEGNYTLELKIRNTAKNGEYTYVYFYTQSAYDKAVRINQAFQDSIRIVVLGTAKEADNLIDAFEQKILDIT